MYQEKVNKACAPREYSVLLMGHIKLIMTMLSKSKKIGVILGLLFFTSFCGRRTAPKPLPEMGVITRSLPLLLSAKSFYREDNLLILWKLPSALIKAEGEKAQIPVKSYRINILRPSSRCGRCEPENIGYFLYNTPLKTLDWNLKFIPREKPLSSQIEYRNGEFSLVLYPENLPDNLFLFTISYQTVDGKLSGKTVELRPRRPIELPSPEIVNVIQFEDSLHIVWKKVEELVRTRFNSKGKQFQMIGYFGVNFYTKSDDGKWVLLNQTPYRGNSIDLKDIELPVFARHIDRFNNESIAIEVRTKKPVDRSLWLY